MCDIAKYDIAICDIEICDMEIREELLCYVKMS